MGACCTSSPPIELNHRRTTRNTESRRRRSVEKTYGAHPLHIAVIRQNGDYLETVLEEIEDIHINELDDLGYTAAQLCVLTGWTDGLKILLAKDASPFMVNPHGWSLIQDSIALSQGQCLFAILDHISKNNSILKQACLQYLHVNSVLSELDDFIVDINWKVSTWVPFIAKYCPKDVIRIYKKGCTIRVDTNIHEFNQARMEWEYNPRLMIFKSSEKGYLDIYEKSLNNLGNVDHIQTYMLDNINDINQKILTMDNNINTPNFVSIELLRDALLYSVIYDLEKQNDPKRKNKRSTSSNVLANKGNNSNLDFSKLGKKLLKHLNTQTKKDMKALLSNKTLAIENLKLFQSKSLFGDIKTAKINDYHCMLYEIPTLSMVSNFRTLKLNSQMKQEFEQVSQKMNIRDQSLSVARRDSSSKSKGSIHSASNSYEYDIQSNNENSSTGDLGNYTSNRSQSLRSGNSKNNINDNNNNNDSRGYAMIASDHVVSHSFAFDEKLDEFEEVEPSQKGVIDLLLSLGKQNVDDSSDEDSDSDFSDDSDGGNNDNNNNSSNNNSSSNRNELNKTEIRQIFHELTQDCDKMATKMIEYNKYQLKIEERQYKLGGNDKSLFGAKIREIWDWERTKQSAKLTLAMYETAKTRKLKTTKEGANENEDGSVNDNDNDEKENQNGFDLTIDEMVAILDIISPKIRHAQNLKEFLMIELPNDGFPLKIEVPFYNLITATLVFENFKREKLDDALFDPNVAQPNGAS